MLPLQEEIRRAWKPMGCFAANGTCQSLLDLTSWRTKLPLDEANSKLSPRGVSLSGFVCIMHGDGAPIERGLLQSLTDLLSFRGPEACGIWSDGPLGMGHTLLRTTHESKNERDRKSTRLNSSHGYISYAVFCLKKKKTANQQSRFCIRYTTRSSSHTTLSS